MSIEKNIQNIREKLPGGCRLIAVTKTHPVELLTEAYNAGQKVFGENKVQEMVEKYEKLPKDIEWHMIGHLQSNKVKYIAPFVSLIHSIDSIKLLTEVNKQAFKIQKVINCLLQIHIALEETKFGFLPDEAKELIGSKELENLKNIKIIGLMGLATNTEDTLQIKKEFKSIKSLFDDIKGIKKANVDVSELSIGMSSDYFLAIEEGSTLIRVGSAIFGNRNYNI